MPDDESRQGPAAGLGMTAPLDGVECNVRAVPAASVPDAAHLAADRQRNRAGVTPVQARPPGDPLGHDGEMELWERVARQGTIGSAVP